MSIGKDERAIGIRLSFDCEGKLKRACLLASMHTTNLPRKSSSRPKLIKRLHKKFFSLWNDRFGAIALLMCAVWALTSVLNIMPSVLYYFEGDCHCDHKGEGRVCAPEIDLVYTWVNGSDPVFLRDMLHYKRLLLDSRSPHAAPDANSNATANTTTNATSPEDSIDKEVEEIASASRYRDNDELRYSLRSVEMNLPWFRHIYLVTNGQVPTWLNVEHPKITVVPHSMIFPNRSHLPTFSSPAIEAHLHRIPGLSHQFIYLNDDVFFGQPVWPDDWTTLSAGQKVFLTWDVPGCNEGCAASWLHDGYCDRACNVAECNFDEGDCVNVSTTGYSSGSSSGGLYNMERAPNDRECALQCPYSWLADRFCDQRCNVKECAFDAGDCGVEKMYEELQGFDLYTPADNSTLNITMDGGHPVAYFNLSDIFPGGTVTDASHTTTEMIVSASVSQKNMMLTLVFKRAHPLPSSTTVSMKGGGVNGTEVSYSFNLTLYEGPVWKHNNSPESDAEGALSLEEQEEQYLDSLYTDSDDPALEAGKQSADPAEGEGDATEDKEDAPEEAMEGEGDAAEDKEDAPEEAMEGEREGDGDERGADEAKDAANGDAVDEGDGPSKDAVAGAAEGVPEGAAAGGAAGDGSVEVTAAGPKSGGNSRLERKRAIEERKVALKKQKEELARKRSVAHDLVQRGGRTAEIGDEGASVSRRQLLQSGGRRSLLLDSFGNSLRHVDKLFTERYGSKARKVPAHMPHFMDTHILQELQSIYPDLYDATSSHRFRASDDMQYAFSYFYYLMQEGKGGTPEDFLRSMDKDHDHRLDDVELYNLLTKIGFLNRGSLGSGQTARSKVVNIHLQLLGREPDPAKPVGWGELGAVPFRYLLNSEDLMQEVEKTLSVEKKYKFELGDVDKNVGFHMLRDNSTAVLNTLEDIRQRPTKFVCLNDNLEEGMDHTQVMEEIQALFQGLFPAASSFELAPEAHGYAHLSEWQQTAQRRNYRKWFKRICSWIPFVAVVVYIVMFEGGKVRRESRFRSPNKNQAGDVEQDQDDSPSANQARQRRGLMSV
ncbi:hypothetical protein CYMTET_47852 [Cymbomonas tetramitiformis]|uniref:LNR domain-containing protein n=1 Tax=Cymbomonas tetramitiformis TaxID=36881 RepID=A0AAE0BV61_9CHLO|nr:hypothetical protein CYMTET_47852 [Cymbomonas tetramitiformis]